MSALAFAKLVATPTDSSWSQVYNAGNLFICLSLSLDAEREDSPLQSVGKEILQNLEAEFFTLEEKTLETIKDVVAKATKDVPSEILVNLVMAYFKNDVLYIFILGRGKVAMKRDGAVGILIEKNDDVPGAATASGFLQNNDTIVLQTPQFASNFDSASLNSALELALPSDVAEALSPHMHETGDGGQAAIIIAFKGPGEIRPQAPDLATITAHSEEEVEVPEESPETEEVNPAQIPEEELPVDKTEEKPFIPEKEIIIEEEEIDIVLRSTEEPATNPESFHPSPRQSKPSFGSMFGGIKSKAFKKFHDLNLTHRQKLILSVVIIISLLLVTSIVLTKKKQTDSANAVLFNSIYEPALKNYEDGLGLQSINQEFARADFQDAQRIIKDGLPKFKNGTTEEEKLSELLEKVESELGGGTSAKTVEPKAIDVSDGDYLSVAKDNDSAYGFTKDGSTTYFITDEAIVSVNGNGDKKDILENDGDWENPTGIAYYQSNFYVLDPENGLIKFTPASDGFGKVGYFKGTSPNLKDAVSVAIDGSVYILLKSGNVLKYTAGVSEDFKITGIDKPLKNPTKIITNLELDNLYILDSGNSRIVVLDKDGGFTTQYATGTLKNAGDFEVSETDGNILFLANGKFFEIPL